MAAKRDNFSDRQKAYIFARDGALCCYSGKSLWLLDYGAEPALVDQVDHLVAASKEGTSDVDNGVLTTFMHNCLRKANGHAVLLFECGLPTMDAFWVFGPLPDGILEHIVRFQHLHYSDWYVNRAVVATRWAAAQLKKPKRVSGAEFSRGSAYCCKAALKRLEQWRAIVKRERVDSLKKRGLLPPAPREDHQPLLRMLSATSGEEIMRAAETLEPFLEASHSAIARQFFQINSVADLTAYAARVKADPFVVPAAKKAVLDYAGLPGQGLLLDKDLRMPRIANLPPLSA